jgi:dTDP-4-amino-4,6-dideoxygalactose transaminase
MFYLVCSSLEQRSKIIEALRRNNILAVFHYLSLHKSPFYQNKHDGRELPESNRYSDCLLRLPLYFELNDSEITEIVKIINAIKYDIS